ncbi:MAG: Flp pilus assembly protein CpaB [Firmicutes bacterium]|nr:Flp pilus assembly protein CpaB [Bacillota bacterium]
MKSQSTTKGKLAGLKARQLVLLVLATGFTGLAVNWYLTGLENEATASAELVPVIVAARDLEEGQALNPADLTIREVPAGFQLEGNYLAGCQKDLVGKTVRYPVQAGEQITEAKLASESEGTALGKRWYIIQGKVVVDQSLLKPGDRVDIIAVLVDEDGKRSATCLLQNVLIAQLVEAGGELYGMGNNIQGVAVEVSLQDAQKLALAEELGFLKLVKRSKTDLATVPVSSVSESEIGRTKPKTASIPYRRVEIISGVESQSVYLPAKSWR